MDEQTNTDFTEIAFLKKRIAELEKMAAREVQHRTAHEHLKQLYEKAPFAYQSLDENGCLIAMNQTWLDKLGYTHDEAIGSNFSAYLPPEWQDHFNAYFPRFKAIGETLGVEFEMVKKDGSTLLTSFDGKIVKDTEGRFLQTHCIFHDISERKQIEEALRQRESYLSAIIENQPGLLWLKDREGRYLSVNSAFAQSCGLEDPELLIGKTDLDAWPLEQAEKYITDDAKVIQSQQPYVIEEPIFDNGKFVWFETYKTPIIDKHGKVIGTTGFSHKITERLQARAYREMARDILQVLNDPFGLSESIQRVIDILISRTGCDAVGIRLQEGEDFPFFAQRGFPQNFLLTENSLLGRTTEGGVCHDEAGNIILECTCGLVISGKTDSTSPLFTAGGSFWTNDSFQLLDIPAEEEPRFQPRNQCIHHEYASFALVPIRNKERIVGLIHFGDQRKNCFTLNSIELLESIASHIGTALMRKQAEEDLLIERKRLADIIAFLPDPTLAVDRDGRVILWNKALEIITGIPAAKMIGKGDYAYAIPFYGEARQQLIDLIFEDNQEIKALYPFITREGEALSTEVFAKALYGGKGAWVFAKASPLRDQTGRIIGAIESIRDITDNKQTERKLKTSLSRLEALFNATDDAVILLEPNGMILDLNANTACRRNIDKSAMLGQNLFDFLPTEAAKVRRQAIDQILTNKSLIHYDEARNEKHYRIRLFPVMDTQGEVVQIALFSRDITEGMQAKEEKKKLQAQLIQAQKMEAIGTLAGGIAHDFNNILGAIIGYAEIARDATNPTETFIVKSLNKVLEAGNRAAALVKQILTFSRQTDIDRVPVNIGHVVKEAVNFLRPSLPSTITIKQNINSATNHILGNPTQMKQIVINLCTNAFHAMEQHGGTLEIVLKDCVFSRQDILHHPGIHPGRFVELTVSDSGQGIQPEILNKIFEPYFTTKNVGKGTGMGLAIVHGIVKSYSGFITCESELEKGSTFHVFLPVMYKKGAIETSREQEITGGNESLLLIDDEKLLAEMGKSILEQLGYTITVHTSSLEALADFQHQPDRFDLVITDQTMPGMTGSDLAQQMLRIRPDLPMILCTGYSSIITEEQVLEMGIKGYALKPFTKRTLATLIRKVLDD